MTLNATVLTVTQPGATGNQTYSLPSNFDPKFIILFGTPQASAGVTAQLRGCIGFGTYRGGVVQQIWSAMSAQDNVASSNTFGRVSNDAICKFNTGSNNTIDSIVQLVSLGQGASSNVVLNWADLHPTASIKLTILVVGGTDITDAMCGLASIASGSTNVDTTVATGFGQPEFVFATHGGDITSPTTFGGQSAWWLGHGAKLGSANGNFLGMNVPDAAATEDVRTGIRDDKLIHSSSGNSGATIAHQASLAASSSWPTNGFRVAFTQCTAALPMGWLAIRTSADVTVTTGMAGARTTTGTTTHSPASGVGTAALLLGLRTLSSNSEVTTGIDNGYISIGAVANDGTQGVCGFLESDDQATASVTACTYGGTAEAIQYYLPTTEAKTSEADGTFTGNDLVLNWTDADTSAWLYQYIIFSVTPPFTTYPGAVSMSATASLTSGGVREVSGAVAMSATASLTAAASRTTSGAVSLSATASLTAAADRTTSGAVSLSAAATLTSDATRVVSGAVSLSAVATLTSGATVYKVGAVSLSATSTLSVAAPSIIAMPTVSLSAIASLTTAGIVTKIGAVSLSAVGTLSVAADRFTSGAVSLTATYSLSTTAFTVRPAAVSMSASASLTSAATAELVAAVSMTATYTIISSIQTTVSGDVAMSAAATLVANAVRDTSGAVSMSAVATLVAQGVILYEGDVAMTATYSLSIAEVRSTSGDVAMMVTATLDVFALATSGGGVAMVVLADLLVGGIALMDSGVFMVVNAEFVADGAITFFEEISLIANAVLDVDGIRYVDAAISMLVDATIDVAGIRERLAEIELIASADLQLDGIAVRPGLVSMLAVPTFSAALHLRFAGALVLTAVKTLTISGISGKPGNVYMEVDATISVVDVNTFAGQVVMLALKTFQVRAGISLNLREQLFAFVTTKNKTNATLNVPVGFGALANTQNQTRADVVLDQRDAFVVQSQRYADVAAIVSKGGTVSTEPLYGEAHNA